MTTQTGNYTIVQVPVGTYHLNVELAGFGRFRQEGIRIFVGQTARIDAKLQVGNLSEEVKSSPMRLCSTRKVRKSRRA